VRFYTCGSFTVELIASTAGMFKAQWASVTNRKGGRGIK
jgi:hypothetical protein